MRSQGFNLISKILRYLTTVLSIGAIAFLLLVSLPYSVLALDSDLEQTATLRTPQPNRPIPIAVRPAPNQPITGYGISGNKITVLEQVGDYMDFEDPNATWCHIRLQDKPYTEGWIQGKFISTDIETP